MKRKDFVIRLRVPVLILIALLLAASSAYAVNLAAVEATWTPPDSTTPITMWGFIEDPGSCPTSPVAWNVGPVQVANTGGNLSIRLRNCLDEPVSLVIPGQYKTLNPVPLPSDTSRVRSFDKEVPVGGTAYYLWSNVKAGTYLYQSGTHPAKQVHMGLYGALKVGRYVEAGLETIVLFSEIDPALHDPVPSTAQPLNYKPKYYLINGTSFSQSQTPGKGPPSVPFVPGGKKDKKLLIRFLNAGLMSHVPVLQGPYMKLLAEDGNRYPYPKERYSFLLAAGKTFDALWHPPKIGNYALYDRRLSLTSNGAVGGGMLVYMDVGKPFPWRMFVPAITGAGSEQ